MSRATGKPGAAPGQGSARRQRRGPVRANSAAPKSVVEPAAESAEGTAEVERISQFTLKLRASLHRELTVLAFDSGMTMRGFVMNALKQQGLDVSDEDLVDRRRR